MVLTPKPQRFSGDTVFKKLLFTIVASIT